MCLLAERWRLGRKFLLPSWKMCRQADEGVFAKSTKIHEFKSANPPHPTLRATFSPRGEGLFSIDVPYCVISGSTSFARLISDSCQPR
ncbi:hypothetical protein GGD54_001809 [Rhizobium tropici]|uniref:Uncharacterized protein n=1 Tax=Rhizobium tropici TaxID=398 RepID=A0ABR6QWU9_RHITR|nr:hypothetical protein [Rhizobium tropici]MBB5592364.1 hypothetical protein [Rhizobium tropici]MBB6491414.1 hypothetical protein [Rhizobium tropici]